MIEDPSPRQRLLAATIACLERDGIAALTIRGIAHAAGVNSAAISYYFGSKDRLVEEALQQTMQTGFALDELDASLAAGTDRRAAVDAFLVQYMTDALRWPRVAAAHLHDPLIKGAYPERLVRGFGGLLAGFGERIGPLLAGRSRASRQRTVVQIWAAVLLPVLLPGLFRDAGMDATSPTARRAYVAQLLDRLLAPSPGTRAAVPR